MVAGSVEPDRDCTSSDSKATASASFHDQLMIPCSFDFVPAQVSIDFVLRNFETERPFIGASQLLKIFDDTLGFSELRMEKKSDPMRATNFLDSGRCLADHSNRVDLILHGQGEQVGSGTVIDEKPGDVVPAHMGGSWPSPGLDFCYARFTRVYQVRESKWWEPLPGAERFAPPKPKLKVKS